MNVESIISHIEEALGEYSKPAIPFSGGKDSTFLLWIIYEKMNLKTPTVFIDTQLHFKETVDFVATLKEKWGLNLHVYTPLKFPNFDDKFNCCLHRKVEPLRRFVEDHGVDLLIEAVRGDEAEWRQIKSFYENKPPATRFYPLKDLSWKEVWNLIFENSVPYNPLYDQGYTSLGCEPCTVKSTGKERDGRVQNFEIMRRLRDLGYF